MLKSRAETQAKPLVKLPLLKDNFGLTKAEFQRYIDNLKNGDDGFITDIMAIQLPDSMSYLKSKFNISHEQSYDVCMDTFLEFRAKLLGDKIKYGNLRYLFTRMCINQFIDKQKHKTKINKCIHEFLRIKNEKSDLNESFFTRMEEAIQLLPEDQQYLLKEFYYSRKEMHLIAKEQGVSYSAIRKKKERILKKLKSFFFDEDQSQNIEK